MLSGKLLCFPRNFSPLCETLPGEEAAFSVKYGREELGDPPRSTDDPKTTDIPRLVKSEVGTRSKRRVFDNETSNGTFG